MTREEFLKALDGLRRANAPGGRRYPQKPLFVLWLLGRFASHGSSACTYAEAEEPVTSLIDEYGIPAREKYRAAMPFFHLESDIWDLENRSILGAERAVLLREGATGSLKEEVEDLLRRDPALVLDAGRFLIDRYFTESYLEPIFNQVGLSIDSLNSVRASTDSLVDKRRRSRSPAFRSEVLLAWRYRCAMCGYDGMLGREPAGLEAAHIQWHSMGGPDEIPNGLALCALHHVLFDLGALGISMDMQVQVSSRFTARSAAGDALVASLHGKDLFEPSPRYPMPDLGHVAWHTREVFKG